MAYRQSWSLLGVSLASFAAVMALSAKPAWAHEKWFQDPSGFPLRWDLFFRPLPLVLTFGVLIAVVAAILLWRRRGEHSFVPGPEAFGATDERRAVIYALVPLILGIHIAIPLLFNGVQGRLFTPDNELPGVFANFLGFAETMIALALFYGAFTRVAAAALALLWVAGIPLMGLEPMLENSLYLGFAAFFFLAGRGPVSIDRLLFPRAEPPARTAEYAVTALRVGLGVSFIVVAFTEKLANIPLAEAFLREYPLNFTSALGVPLSDEVFILFAGSVELMLGIFLLTGIFTREIVLLALVPTNLTLTVFNWAELIGHLPIYGILAVLLIWEPGKRNLALWLRGLREGPLPIPPAKTSAVGSVAESTEYS